jgi:ABC-type uncharacterized transport system substrate-binding protein
VNQFWIFDFGFPIPRLTGPSVFGFALGAVLLALCTFVEAQQAKKVPRIGFLSGVSLSTNPTRPEAFRQGLRELGYIEGNNIIIDWRYAEGKLDRLSELAAELVNLKVDVIVTAAPPPTRAAKQATVTIPIVMAFDDDPVGSGFVSSLARPGGNITGLSAQASEISGKQLEVLKEIVPNLARVGILGDVTRPGIPQALREINVAADAFHVQVQYLEVRAPKDIEVAFRAAIKERADALVVLGSPAVNLQQKQIAVLAVKNRLAVIYTNREFVEAGGFVSYGVSFADLFHRAAAYVDKILKGAKPADLPVEQPTKFELVINLKTAKQIGLTIPPNVLARADRVIR